MGKTIVMGTISSSRGPLYRLKFWKDDLHVVELLDPTKFPQEREPRSIARQLSPRSAGADAGLGACTDSPQQIDVMVAYTDDALANTLGGTQAMELMIYEAVAQANESYIRSNIQQRLRLVHVVEVGIDQDGNIDDDLDALQKVDTVMDGGTLRDQYAADAVVLITESSSERGLSNVMETVDHSFENQAFAVVLRAFATTVYTFAHELGHIMSARHDRAADNKENLPYAYNHAHAEPVPTTAGVKPWRTIMATTKPCDDPPTVSRVPIPCPRLLQWSNPDVDWNGDATGVKDFEDNARTLNNTAPTVANFRCSSQGVPIPQSVSNVHQTWVRNSADPKSRTSPPAREPERKKGQPARLPFTHWRR